MEPGWGGGGDAPVAEGNGRRSRGNAGEELAKVRSGGAKKVLKHLECGRCGGPADLRTVRYGSAEDGAPLKSQTPVAHQDPIQEVFTIGYFILRDN